MLIRTKATREPKRKETKKKIELLLRLIAVSPFSAFEKNCRSLLFLFLLLLLFWLVKSQNVSNETLSQRKKATQQTELYTEKFGNRIILKDLIIAGHFLCV